MVLAEAGDVEPDLIGEPDGLEELRHARGGADAGIATAVPKGVDPEFHTGQSTRSRHKRTKVRLSTAQHMETVEYSIPWTGFLCAAPAPPCDPVT